MKGLIALCSICLVLATNAMQLRMSIAPKKVLIIGGTRFSGLYLWKELYDRVSSAFLTIILDIFYI